MNYHDALQLLLELIATPSHSTREDQTAALLFDYLQRQGTNPRRKYNNIWVKNKYFDVELPTILLNSHHDTVKPAGCWIRKPYQGDISDGKVYGLGSNDAGASLVSLMAAFLYFYESDDLPFNLIYSATAEEENSGKNGIESIWYELGKIDVAIVGEPTSMEMVIAEKGLVVLDCIAKGKSGHAARDTGINAIDIAVQDIGWLHSFQFPKVSPLLGPVKMTCTVIEAGSLHNIIPDTCKFTVDVRPTDAYTNEEIVEIIKANLKSEVIPRSLRLRSSKISTDHPVVLAAQDLGIPCVGSPTTSDQAVMPVESVKIGPGDSRRSHTIDEFVYVEEIETGIDTYIRLLEQLIQRYRLYKKTIVSLNESRG
ncbi:MAG: M20 family metallo-hydrolase [Calditrichia bacterium]